MASLGAGRGAPAEGGEAVGAGPLLDESGKSLNEQVDEFERRLIVEALERSDGVKSRAAKLLGIKRTTLVEKMKKKQIAFPR